MSGVRPSWVTLSFQTFVALPPRCDLAVRNGSPPPLPLCDVTWLCAMASLPLASWMLVSLLVRPPPMPFLPIQANTPMQPFCVPM